MKHINTGGGAYIGGNVNTSGGFVGRDSTGGTDDGIIDNNDNLLSYAFTGGIMEAYGMRWRLKQPVEKKLGRFVYVQVEGE